MITASEKSISILNVSRLSWADVCRTVSIFGVILIHASIDTLKQFEIIPLSDWMAANLFNSLVRCSVPLFVMLSGALLLKSDVQQASDVTVRQIFRRVGKVALPLLTWNIAYLFYLAHYTGQPVNWMSMLSQAPAYHLWFVYMMIGVYILLPVLQAIFKMMVDKKSLQIYFFALWFFVTCIPIYQPIPLLSLLQQQSIFGYGGYFLLGSIIATSLNKKYSTLFWFFIYFVSVAATFYLTLYFSNKAHSAVEDAYVSFSPNVFFSSVAAFILFTRIELKNRLALIFKWIADRSFLVFFMHVVVLERAIVMVNSFFPMGSSYLTIFASAMLTFMLCLMMAAVLRFLPKSREVIG